MPEEPTPEQGTFNFALQYLERLNDIERELDIAFARDNYKEQFKTLNVLWVNLYEWIGKKEEEEFEDIREKAKQVNKYIEKALINKTKTIPTEYLEVYWNWAIMLKKLINKRGLRMPKKDDPAFALK